MDTTSPDFSSSSSSTTGVPSQQSHDNFSASLVSSSHDSFSTACFGFQFFLNTVFLGILCILGFVGNTISFLVFQRDRHNRVPVFLLQSLAVADNSLLCTAFIALSVFYGIVPILGKEVEEQARPHIVRFLNPLACVAQSCTIWMTVLLAINRYFAVCRPFTTEKWLTMKHARIQVFSVVFFSLLVNIPRVFEQDIPRIAANCTALAVGTTSFTVSTSSAAQPTVGIGGNFTDSSTLSSNASETVPCDSDMYWYFEVVYLNAFYTSVILILPILLLIGFNIPLVRQLQTSKREMIRNSLSYSGQQENNITVVMVMIILQLIICHSPDRVVQIVRIFVDDSRKCLSPLYYAVNIANFLVILNSSTDFIVYYVFRNRFRAILCDQLFCRRPRSNSWDVVAAWNSRTDQGAKPLVRINSNGQGASPPGQRIEEDGQDRSQPSPESDRQTTSLVRNIDLQTTEPHDHHKTTSVVL